MSEIPPPLPPQIPSNESSVLRSSSAPATVGDASYNLMADKVGLVPNLRKKDNIYQAVCVVVFVVSGAIAGRVWSGGTDSTAAMEGLLVGALGGLVVGGLLSGAVLMVIGLIRKS